MHKITIKCMIVLLLTGAVLAEENSDLRIFSSSSPSFSFRYPEEFVNLPLQGETEVVRLSAPNMFKVPVLVAHVERNRNELKRYDLTKRTIDRLKAKTPGIYGFKAAEQKNITLNDGTSAFFLKLTWKWVDGTQLETTSVFAVQDDSLITVTATAFKDQNLSDILTYLCMTLTLDSE